MEPPQDDPFVSSASAGGKAVRPKRGARVADKPYSRPASGRHAAAGYAAASRIGELEKDNKQLGTAGGTKSQDAGWISGWGRAVWNLVGFSNSPKSGELEGHLTLELHILSCYCFWRSRTRRDLAWAGHQCPPEEFRGSMHATMMSAIVNWMRKNSTCVVDQLEDVAYGCGCPILQRAKIGHLGKSTHSTLKPRGSLQTVTSPLQPMSARLMVLAALVRKKRTDRSISRYRPET